MNIIKSGLVFKSNMAYGNIPMEIVLHHAEASSCTVYDIHSWHLANGWAGIGYHYFVRKDGSIYTGRPESAIGSHCPGANPCSIGVCAEGDYTKETMPAAQKESLIELGKYIAGKYKIRRVVGHREVPYPTTCPGDNYPTVAIRVAIMGTVVSKPVTVSSPTPVATTSTITSDIKSIQTILNSLGSKLTVDGATGAITKAEASKHSLTVGEKDNLVKWVQLRLISKGCSCGTAGADGSFGDGTIAAIKKFQTANKLTSDGKIGPNTWSALLS